MTAYIHTLIYWYAYQNIYPFSLAITKCSFLALYRRVFPPPNMIRSCRPLRACLLGLADFPARIGCSFGLQPHSSWSALSLSCS